MSSFTINQTDITDFMARGHLNDILDEAKRHVSGGRRVVIQHEFVNALPDVVREFSTIEEFESFLRSVAALTKQTVGTD